MNMRILKRYWRAEEIKQPKHRATLIDHAAQIRLSRQLVELTDCATPLTSLDDLEVRAPYPETLLGFLAEMNFALTARIASKLGAEPLATATALETPAYRTAGL